MLLAGIRDAEDALKLWLHLRSGGDQLRAIDLYESKEVCARCAGGPMTFQGRDRTPVCMDCRQPWRARAVAVVEPRVGAAQERCSHCDAGRKVRRDGALRCAACSRPWAPTTETLAVGGGGGSRVRRDLLPLERIAGLLLMLRRVVEARPRDFTQAGWTFDLRAFALCAEADGRSYAQAAEDGERLWPELEDESESRWWSEWKVREAVARARYVIERRLADERSSKRRRAPLAMALTGSRP